jgi:hypothetical protein
VDADVVVVGLNVCVVIKAERGMDSCHAAGKVDNEGANQVEDEPLWRVFRLFLAFRGQGSAL